MEEKSMKLKNSQAVQAKKEEKKESDDYYTIKLGKFRRATVLYNFERFTEAFKLISEVAKSVR